MSILNVSIGWDMQNCINSICYNSKFSNYELIIFSDNEEARAILSNILGLLLTT